MIIKEEFNLSNNNSYKLNSICKRAYFIENKNDIEFYFNENSLENTIVLGSGHNVILTRNYYEENFLIFSQKFNSYEIHQEFIKVAAGMDLRDLSVIAAELNLSGLEVFYDIPSSVGGAVVMNAGASGEDIKGVLHSVTYFDPNKLCFDSISEDELEMEYRNSFFQKNPQFIIVEVILKLTKSNKNLIWDKMNKIKKQRWEKQPRDYPNAGSVFKRPKGYYVGEMMDNLNLKGFSIGGAMIAEKHGGFIINYDLASGKDIIELIDYIQEKVYSVYGFKLEVEQRLI